MDIRLKNFRCFEDSGRVKIAPITILVGENSTGKTSFLSAYRGVLDYFHGIDAFNFNKDPFELGSFDQIIHYRGGGHKKKSHFSIEIEKPVRSTALRKRFGVSDIQVHLELNFQKDGLKTLISGLKISSDFFQINYFREGKETKITFDIIGEQAKMKSVQVPSSWQAAGFPFHPRYLMYMFEDVFLSSRNIEKNEALGVSSADIKLIMQIYNSFFRNFYRPAYASSPVRTQPDRVYSQIDDTPKPSGNHIPVALARLKAYDREKWHVVKENLDNFGRSSGLFGSIDVIKKGKTETDPFEVRLKSGGVSSNIIDVGYGVSQILPIIGEMFLSDNGASFIFQQPEVHLHPRAQAELGSLFADVQKNKNHHFMIETHSDYIIDRLAIEIQRKSIRPDTVSIVYFDKSLGQTKATSMAFDEDGNLSGAPPNYRDFFTKETLDRFGV